MGIVAIIVKMYALIRKSAWPLLRALVDRKNAADRGTRPEANPQETAWVGFRRGRSRGAAVDGIRHMAKRGAKREREAERCLTTLFRVGFCSSSSTERYIYTPRAYTPTICSGVG